MMLLRKNLLVFALLVSVVVNLFLAGVVGAQLFSRPEPPPAPVGMMWMNQSLDPQARDRVQSQMRQANEELRQVRRQMLQAQREVNLLLVQDPLDTEALTDAFARLRQASEAYQERSHGQLLNLMSRLTVEQRQQALRRLSVRRAEERPPAARRPPADTPSTPQ
ncbi:periplasmic heavy metal sensor [Pseudohongiella sp. SYSU M77423]|uniref:periplasmic heavy metal sensor n=1 Tax=Pseudohongiella sp. SYSU M77423 TaxID=3042312 RepID=UPI00247FB452|nr:periplasmic heavy metal sensor [Pseudohongiella sp. SYSU M77423]MDH7944502.1 periplasmic heavy metal sensor [Pseudohongiella sp. SYSU M77423]MEC8858648.1 periplasmic heavy metal sensor [Pseudomonadota bacterium]